LLLVLEGDLLARLLLHAGSEEIPRRRDEIRVDGPVLPLDELPDLVLALADQAERDRLHAAGREAVADRAPEERAHLVAHETVEDAARLLRLHLGHVDRARMLERLGDTPLRDLVERGAADVVGVVAERLGEMPRDRLPLAIGVGREIDGGRAARAGLEVLEDLPFALDEHVGRLEALLDVDAQFALREIADVPVRGLHLVSGTEVLGDGPGLGRRLDDDQIPPTATRWGRLALRGRLLARGDLLLGRALHAGRHLLDGRRRLGRS